MSNHGHLSLDGTPGCQCPYGPHAIERMGREDYLRARTRMDIRCADKVAVGYHQKTRRRGRKR